MLRDPRTLLVVFVQPLLLMVIYGYAVSFDIYHVPFAVWDQDHTQTSRKLVEAFSQGGRNEYFSFAGYVGDPRAIEPLISLGQVRFVLVIPTRFAADIGAGKLTQVQALIDGADSNTAGIALGYATGVLNDFNARIALTEQIRRSGRAGFDALAAEGGQVAGSGGDRGQRQGLDVRTRFYYNPDLSSTQFIVPGLIALLLTTLAALLTSTCIAREREMGTLESVLTSQVRPTEFVLGKLLPYVAIAVGDVLLVLIVGGLVFHVWARGNLLTLSAFSLLFLISALALGLLISARMPAQQPALVLALLATTLPTTFLTGFAFPRNDMPLILQWISWPLPATQYIIALRGVFMKGIGWSILWPQGLVLTVTSYLLVRGSIRAFKKQL